MSRGLQTADEGRGPLCSAAGRLRGQRCRSVEGAAARLVLAFVRWQIRRLERRMAALEIDDHPLN